LILYAAQIRSNQLPLPIHDGKFAPNSAKDVAEAIACILSDTDRHNGKTYNITGPHSIGGKEFATIMSQALELEIQFEDVPLETARALLLQQNVPSHEVEGLLQFYQRVQEKDMDFMTSDMDKICSHSGEQLLDFCRRNRKLLFH
jgi:NAD(P)H dehydrogenase (quinone)